MKRNDRKLVQEALQASMISEGIIDSLLMMFLSPKLKRDTDKLKNSPDWKELVQKINSTRDEMDMYNKRLSKYLIDYNKIVADAKKKGIKVKPNATIEDIIAMTSKY